MDSKVGKRRRVERVRRQKKGKENGVRAGKLTRTEKAEKRRDEEVASSEEDDDDEDIVGRTVESDGQEDNEVETAEEKRLRVAKAYLQKIRDSTREESDDDDRDEENEEARRGARDSRVSDILAQERLEESGRVQRKIAERVVASLPIPEGKTVSRRHRQSVTAVCLTEDDSRGFAASKDGLIVHWDVETGKSEKYDWPVAEQSTSGGTHASKTKSVGSKHVLAMAVSSNGTYLAAGGLGRILHVWDTRSRKPVMSFPGHKGAISSLAFRQGTQQLMSGSHDRTIKLWSVDDKSYVDTLYGHQSEVLCIDCLRQERVLSAGRDRTLRLWKIPEESQLVFRGHAPSIDCCCMVSNTEFFSGSDDGSVALWNNLRKKPLLIIKNAHGSVTPSVKGEDKQEPVVDRGSNGQVSGSSPDDGSRHHIDSCIVGGAATSWVGAVASCRGSDLVASSAGDGTVKLWSLVDDNRSLKSICSIPVKGFVNALAIANSGRFLLTGVGQEPRLGRWGRIPGVRNGVLQHTLVPMR